MNIGIIALGNLGTALAQLICSNGNEVQAWEYQAAVVDEVNHQHTNTRYLSGIPLSPNLHATTRLEELVQSSDIIFVTLPSAYIKETLACCANLVPPQALVVNLAKGIDPGTGLTAFQTLETLFPHNPCFMLAGPSIANEFARGMPTLVVLAGKIMRDMVPLARVLDTHHFRVRFSTDTLGVELGGILKNVYAIGLGFFDGKQIKSANFRAAYLTLALEEMVRFGAALGAQPETFYYLAGIGDLLATSLSEQSHNRRLGEMLASGRVLGEIEATLGVLPEGYQTLKTVLLLAEKVHIPMPLALGLWNVINGHYTAETFMDAFVRDFID